VEMAYYIAEYLINTYTDTPSTPKEKRIKHLLMNRQIYFVPMVNPDGHNVTISRDRMWRVNNASHAVPAGSVTRTGGQVKSWNAGTFTGVDINRNYDTQAKATPGGGGTMKAWGEETFHPGTTIPATSRDPNDGEVWCGPSAASEKETQMIQNLLQGSSPAPTPTPMPPPSPTPTPAPGGGGGFRAIVSFHNFGETWLWPGPLASGSDSPFVDWVGKGVVVAMGTVGIAYKYTGGPSPYLVSGDMIDFSFEASNWRPAYTPEVRPANSDPAAWSFSGLPETQIEPCFKENLAATLAVINCAGFDAQTATQSVSTKTGTTPQPCQFVRNCWEVFKNWTP
jgi:hypothetical protein